MGTLFDWDCGLQSLKYFLCDPPIQKEKKRLWIPELEQLKYSELKTSENK